MVNCYPLIYKRYIVNYFYNRTTESIEDILKKFNISNGSLYNWIHLDKLNNLSNKKKYIKKSKITENIKKYIYKYIIRKMIFNYRKLIQLIKKKFNIIISKSSLYKTIKICKITRKKIRIMYIYKTKNKHREEINTFKNKINKIDKNKLISVDETHIDTNIHGIYGWNRKGKKIIKPKYIKNKKRYTIITGINNKKVIYYKIIKDSAKKEDFYNFIEEMINKNKLKNCK